MNRVAGLETEYGCLHTEAPGSPAVVTKVRDWIFRDRRHGLIDVHQRDWDEPPGNGGFLFNGGRCYIDMGHLEYCTPECSSLLDLYRYDAAGDAILTQAVKSLHFDREAGFIRNNIDHYSGATFGCHENYLVRRGAPLTEGNVHSLLAFLTLRVLYTGAGRVGAAADARGEAPRAERDNRFQISQRADFITNDLFEWVQFNRAIINTRDEPLADARKYRRLHLLHGDTSVLPATLLLKIGTTSLVLDLLELNALPKIALADAVSTFRALSHQPEGPWLAPLAGGRSADVVGLLQRYHAAAAAELAGRDAETDLLLTEWGAVLEGLAGDADSLVGRVDWITKRFLLGEFARQGDIPWNHPWMKSQDLEFHHVDPARSLGLALAQTPAGWQVPLEEITRATTQPPANTRAAVRSRAMRLLAEAGEPYFIDWEVAGPEGGEALHLLDPFDAAPAAAADWEGLVAACARHGPTRPRPV